MVGCTITNAQTNDTKRDRNRLAGYDSRPCMAGKFPPKRHIYVCRHKRVRRDSGGWGWVRMGAGGCISTQQTQNKTNRHTYRSVGHNFGKGVCAEIGEQGWRGRHMSATEHIGQYRGCNGCPGTPHACTCNKRCISVRKNNKKKKNRGNNRTLQKWPKGQKTENNIKCSKKRGKKEKKDRTGIASPSHSITKPAGKKKQTKTAENRVKRAYVVTKKPATTNSAKLEIQKWVKKNKKNK